MSKIKGQLAQVKLNVTNQSKIGTEKKKQGENRLSKYF